MRGTSKVIKIKNKKIGTVKVVVRKKTVVKPTASTANSPQQPTATSLPLTTVHPSSLPTLIPSPSATPDMTSLELSCQLNHDSMNSNAVRQNADGIATVNIPGSYGNLFIPIGDDATYDLSSYSKMVIDYETTDQFRLSIFDSKNNNLKPPTSGTAEWSKWEYLGNGSYDGKQTIDIKYVAIRVASQKLETIKVRNIEFYGNAHNDKVIGTPAANNIYGYEIWNEPTGTWTSITISFEEFWKATYELIRKKDPDAKIIGPSYATFDQTRIKMFLQYCIDNECLPDIMCWHELTNVGNTSNNIKNYRKMEEELGISPLRISINEYCDGIKEREGAPGPGAAYIAKFERYDIDSACLSWWFNDSHGLLGSLLVSTTQKGAGWYFYKWYGDMTGDMLSVTPPNENSKYVDGFASSDDTTKEITCLFGGDTDESKIIWNDGILSVTLKECSDTSGYRIYISKK